MQYHIDNYVIGDPDIKQPMPGLSSDSAPPATCDVLIVGCGPAGLTAAAQLAAFPDIHTCVVEQKPGPLERGQADGIACRTVEMFQAFGFAHKVLREAYHVNETTFWRTDEDTGKGIYRSGRVQDTEDGLSEFPHVILNQARVHDHYLELMQRSPRRNSPFYNRTLISVIVNNNATYPITATLQHQAGQGATHTETIKAKYLIGGDGARSKVRSELGLSLKGDSASQAWGVMDVLAVTDFPDIRMKSIINAGGGGSIVLIPREGGYLVRIYVEMDKLEQGERVRTREFDAQDIIAAANKVFHPYKLDVRHVAWWSVYEIGQRLTDRFDNGTTHPQEPTHPTIFIAGDACHTHSPKAGQGMNVSMQDAFNLGWKLAVVLRGRASPNILNTYNAERHTVARELIEFDKEWAELLHQASTGDSTVSPQEVQKYFTRSGRYTAGTATHYKPSLLTGTNEHQALATGITVGKRFHSSQVIRLADAKPMQLGHVAQADGRFRLFIFAPLADELSSSIKTLCNVCDFLEQAPASPLRRYPPPGDESDSMIDVRAILPYHFRDLEISAMPPLLLPRKGQYQLRDYEKIFCVGDTDGSDFYYQRGIDKNTGCMIVVRPDQYVSQVLPLSATSELAAFFDNILLDAN